MKGKSLLLLLLSLLLVLGLGGGIAGVWEEARAEGPEAPGQAPLLASPVGTAFTYQGRLTDGGSPVDGTCDFLFTLWDSLSDLTGQVGGVQSETSVPVTNGLFTVQLNGAGEFGTEAFTGEARWLLIALRCPAGSGDYTPLSPRQELTATPYALSLRPEAKVAGATAAVDDAIVTVENTGLGIGLKVDGASYGIRSSGYFGVHGEGSVGVQGIGSYGVYGESAASFGGAAVYGLATGDGGTTGVRGEANSSLGTGVHGEAPFFGVNGFASATSGTNYGVYGESGSPDGYGVYGQNTGGGVAIHAAGSGIIKSDAETHLAVNPFEIEATSEIAANLGLQFLHHWLGYTQIWNDSYTQGTIYVPVHNFTTLFGSPFKLDSLEVCYQTTSGSYITQTKVYYADKTGGRTTLISDETDRSSTTWDCYVVTDPSPEIIDGPMLVYFNLVFAGTGDTHKITIGRMVATLVE